METGYWRGRLFRNTYTYKGRRRRVNGWSVKIQVFGRRETFSLSSSDADLAAGEACQIYQAISTQGWDAVHRRPARAAFRPLPVPAGPQAPRSGRADTARWESRLIHRKYPERADGAAGNELSVRIEHLGISRYFPLGTSDEARAAAEARRIHQTVVGEGWAVANQKFTRELSVALRWLENPLAWTYTTIHTWKGGDPLPGLDSLQSGPVTRRVAILEPDAGLRYALAACVNNQEGFYCRAAYVGATDGLRELPRQPADLVLVNVALPDRPGPVVLEAVRRTRPESAGLLYSVFEDSDELFKATPGGAAGYMLKRTSPQHLFEPIADAAGPLTRGLIATQIREYFQRLVAAMPAGTSAVATAKLTPREYEILSLLAKGHLAKEIADALGISFWTVQGHVKSIFEKLNVHTRTEAVVKFLQK